MEVTEVKRIRGKIRLTVGDEKILITRKLYEENPVQEGEDLDLEKYDRFLLLNQYRPALEYAVSLLAARPHAQKEIEDSLKRIGYRPQTIEMVIYKLASNNLLNDAEFARQWANARANRGVGQKRIESDLKRKGISSETIRESMEEVDPDGQMEAAVDLAEKYFRKARPGEDPRKTKQRAYAALMRRGFGYDTAREALERAASGTEEGDE